MWRSIAITTSPARRPSTTTRCWGLAWVCRGSQGAVVNWQTFNVGSAATVNFQQPSANVAILNRVLDSNPSQIYGSVNAPGQVFFVNPAGVCFGATASVSAGEPGGGHARHCGRRLHVG
ncbi:filamentous hemagglutinin N-terminal domain-containing protein [Pandoraea communis]|uniref:filamentous hemagglutinin N-terminal domain-containing protein n=1 Tax=Pandoraea communis TaxID=2508297 RepID=UPI001242F523|nr:filamentous hemagglutinin N-terminal domain-containing protein [Pandoraea communis]